MNLIQQLKDNEKPFGLMSEEMQVKANEIGCTEFDYYGTNVWESYPSGDFYNDQACRLRADYEDENEIVECEITEADGHLHFKYTTDDGMRHAIHQACDHRDFIGFKFEDGVVSGVSIRYLLTCGHFNTFALKEFAQVKVIHASHVLFRQKK